MRAAFAIPDRAKARDEPNPIGKQNKNEDGCEEPKGLFDQIMANNALEEIVKALHEPLPKILRAARHWLDIPRSVLSKYDQSQRHNPCYKHGIGNKPTPAKPLCFWWN